MTSSPSTGARPPAVSGTFYPGDAAELASALDLFLTGARQLQDQAAGPAPAPKAIIAPHAGYRYSGAIAANVYARIIPAAAQIRRVVLLGPAHRVAVAGLAVPSVQFFETPLGRVPLDLENIAVLKAQSYTEVSDAAHAEEHSLEVHIPFLQKLLPDFMLTPVVVGGANGQVVEDALQRVWGGPETLIVISSDLSHYHEYQESQQRDTSTSMAIMSLAVDRLRSQDACGCRPVNGLLRRARSLGLRPTTIDVRNSGDTASPHDRVVGYGAWAFTNQMDPGYRPLEDEHKKEILRVTAAAIARAASGGSMPKVVVGSFAPALQRPGATFVTLTRNGRLRGCLGSLQAYRPLVLDAAERAFASASKDPRFPAVTRDELRGMHVEVALLTSPRTIEFDDEASLLNQLRPGTDGLIIEDEGKRSTFLPKVWDEIREPGQFLQRLKQKAGLDAGHWSPGFKAWRYETERFGSSFAAN